MSSVGPSRGVLWVVDDEERVRAKQADMVSIDVRFAIRWITTMRGLVDQNLDDQQFTKRRMEELAQWTKDRKREGHNIHYRYDPRRRNPKLVDREIQRMKEKMDAHVAAFKELERLAQAPHPVVIEAPQRPIAAFDTKTPRASATVTPRRHRDLTGVHPAAVEMIARDTGIKDLEYASDQVILQAYAARSRQRPDQAQRYVDLLNGGAGGVSAEA